MRKGRLLLPAVLLLVGCDTPADVGPSDPLLSLAQAGTSAQSRPHYLYQGNPVYLRAEWSEVTVSLEEAVPFDELRSRATDIGLSLGSARPIGARGGGHARFRVNAGDLSQTVGALRRVTGVRFASPAFLTEAGDTIRLLEEMIVRFTDGTSSSEIRSLVADLGVEIVQAPDPRLGQVEYLISYPTDADPLAFAAALSDHPNVAWAEPNRISTGTRLTSGPSDPYYSEQYYFNNASTGVDINIEPAWTYTLGGGIPSQGGIRVAVVDDGVHADHPDFGSQVQVGWAWDAVNGDHVLAADPQCPDDNHGTSVAGIILGEHDNAFGHAGGAPDVNLIPIRVFTECGQYGTFQAATPYGFATALRWAWYFAAADVVSNSWRTGLSNAITDAINDGVSDGRDGKGTTFVFAAGNDSERSLGDFKPMTYPGYLPAVIGVGAITRTGDPADYTPRDSRLDIVAPSGRITGDGCQGEGDVLSAEGPANFGCDNGPGGDVNYTTTFSGTSAAAPQVSVAAALLYAVDPDRTESQVRDLILDNATYWGRADDFGAGLLDIGAAVAVQAELTGPSEVYAYKSCTWYAQATGGAPPYQYQWYRDGSPVGTSSSYTANSGGSDFTVSVRVIDSIGVSQFRSLDVTVVPGSPWVLTCEVE